MKKRIHKRMSCSHSGMEVLKLKRHKRLSHKGRFVKALIRKEMRQNRNGEES